MSGLSSLISSRMRLGGFVLLLVSVWATATVALNGFMLDSMTEALGYWGRAGLTFACCLALCSALTFGRQKSGVIGFVAFAAVSAVLVMGSLAMSAGPEVYADSEGNYLFFALAVIIVSLIACLLTRSLAGSMGWFVAAAFICSVIQAFYERGEVPMSIIASAAALALIVYKNFGTTAEGAQLGSDASRKLALPVALASVLVCAGVSCGVWAVIIGPLSPGAVDVKLLTDYRRLPIEEYKGTSQEKPQFNYEMTSQNLVDGEYYTTDDLVSDPTSDKVVNATSVLEQNEMNTQQQNSETQGGGGGQNDDLSEDSNDPTYDAFSYSQEFPWVILWGLLALLLVALIVGYFVMRRRLRMKRLRSYLEQEPIEQVTSIYRFLLPRLARLGFAQPDGMTLREFAHAAARSMDVISDETRVSFEDLTETYLTCVYGDCVPSEDEIVPFVTYYLGFWKAAYTYLGPVRYFFKSFFL